MRTRRGEGGSSIPGLGARSLRARRWTMAAQNVVRRWGIEIHRHRPAPPSSNILALTISDVLLRKVLSGQSPRDFTFLQIGANNGVTDDPIRLFVLRYGFRGVLVEPQPAAFEALRRNYAGREGLIFENAAVSWTEGTAKMFRFRRSSLTPKWADCLSSFSREVLAENFEALKGEIEELEVPTVTFAGLLAKHGIASVDLLQVDTEGFDYEVIKMIDFAIFRPTIINFEQGLLVPAVRQECYAHLSRQGYRITENEFDAVAYVEPADQALSEIRTRVD